MNKKILIFVLLILFIPAIVCGIWFYSVSGDNYTTSNVATVTLVAPDENEWVYESDEDKLFFTELASNLVEIEKQEFSSEIWTVYTLELERTFDSKMLYLCLSPNAKNCLAYDEDGVWYRINTDDARKFLVREELEGVYTNRNCPDLVVSLSGNEFLVPTKSYIWSYLLADGTFSTVEGAYDDIYSLPLMVSASTGFNFVFSHEPDWHDIKIFDGETLVFSGDSSSLNTFSYQSDAILRAVVSSKWYQNDANLYYGESVNEFTFSYDVRATATLNKDSYQPGELAWAKLDNAQNDTFEFVISDDFDTSDDLCIRNYNDNRYLLIPISSYNKTGTYLLTLKSDFSNINLTINVAERYLEDASITLGSASASVYQNALEMFVNEVSSLDTMMDEEPLWINGAITPVVKYEEGRDRYWISAPSYGVNQIVDGMKIGVKNFGLHYVKSVDFESIHARAICDGVIVMSKETEAFGKTLVIDHGFGVCSVYGRLESLNFTVGARVKRGDEIGVSSEEGIRISRVKQGEFDISTTQAQVFFGICVDGVFINPYQFITEQTKPEDSEITVAPQVFNDAIGI